MILFVEYLADLIQLSKNSALESSLLHIDFVHKGDQLEDVAGEGIDARHSNLREKGLQEHQH